MTECKERWKNLRTAFLRSVKSSLKGSASRGKRAYYLHEAMQFILPFMKTTTVVNLETSSDIGPRTDFELSSQETLSISASSEHADFDSLPPMLTPSPTPELTRSPSPSLSPSISHHSLQQPEQFENTFHESSIFRKQPSKRRKITAFKNDPYKADVEYYTMVNGSRSPTSEKKQAIQQFLSSLVPDLVELTDIQLRCFKRRTLLVIDEVLGNTPETLCGTSCMLIHQ